MPRIPRGLVDGFIYHEARKGSLSPFPPLIRYPIGVIEDAKACLKRMRNNSSQRLV